MEISKLQIEKKEILIKIEILFKILQKYFFLFSKKIIFRPFIFLRFFLLAFKIVISKNLMPIFSLNFFDPINIVFIFKKLKKFENFNFLEISDFLNFEESKLFFVKLKLLKNIISQDFEKKQNVKFFRNFIFNKNKNFQKNYINLNNNEKIPFPSYYNFFTNPKKSVKNFYFLEKITKLKNLTEKIFFYQNIQNNFFDPIYYKIQIIEKNKILPKYQKILKTSKIYKFYYNNNFSNFSKRKPWIKLTKDYYKLSQKMNLFEISLKNIFYYNENIIDFSTLSKSTEKYLRLYNNLYNLNNDFSNESILSIFNKMKHSLKSDIKSLVYIFEFLLNKDFYSFLLFDYLELKNPLLENILLIFHQKYSKKKEIIKKLIDKLDISIMSLNNIKNLLIIFSKDLNLEKNFVEMEIENMSLFLISKYFVKKKNVKNYKNLLKTLLKVFQLSKLKEICKEKKEKEYQKLFFDFLENIKFFFKFDFETRDRLVEINKSLYDANIFDVLNNEKNGFFKEIKNFDGFENFEDKNNLKIKTDGNFEAKKIVENENFGNLEKKKFLKKNENLKKSDEMVFVKGDNIETFQNLEEIKLKNSEKKIFVKKNLEKKKFNFKEKIIKILKLNKNLMEKEIYLKIIIFLNFLNKKEIIKIFENFRNLKFDKNFCVFISEFIFQNLFFNNFSNFEEKKKSQKNENYIILILYKIACSYNNNENLENSEILEKNENFEFLEKLEKMILKIKIEDLDLKNLLEGKQQVLYIKNLFKFPCPKKKNLYPKFLKILKKITNPKKNPENSENLKNSKNFENPKNSENFETSKKDNFFKYLKNILIHLFDNKNSFSNFIKEIKISKEEKKFIDSILLILEIKKNISYENFPDVLNFEEDKNFFLFLQEKIKKLNFDCFFNSKKIKKIKNVYFPIIILINGIFTKFIKFLFYKKKNITEIDKNLYLEFILKVLENFFSNSENQKIKKNFFSSLKNFEIGLIKKNFDNLTSILLFFEKYHKEEISEYDKQICENFDKNLFFETYIKIFKKIISEEKKKKKNKKNLIQHLILYIEKNFFFNNKILNNAILFLEKDENVAEFFTFFLDISESQKKELLETYNDCLIYKKLKKENKEKYEKKINKNEFVKKENKDILKKLMEEKIYNILDLKRNFQNLNIYLKNSEIISYLIQNLNLKEDFKYENYISLNDFFDEIKNQNLQKIDKSIGYIKGKFVLFLFSFWFLSSFFNFSFFSFIEEIKTFPIWISVLISFFICLFSGWGLLWIFFPVIIYSDFKKKIVIENLVKNKFNYYKIK